MGDIKTKVHEICYIEVRGPEAGTTLLAASTEDGRVLFFSTKVEDLVQPAKMGDGLGSDDDEDEQLPSAKLVASLGGRASGVTTRIKDFTILQRKTVSGVEMVYVVGGSSDGKLRAWGIKASQLLEAARAKKGGNELGKLLGEYGTQNRITCLEAFVMIPRPEGVEESDAEGAWEDESDEDDDDDDEE